jgi:probable phosphoglycerate mutase
LKQRFFSAARQLKKLKVTDLLTYSDFTDMILTAVRQKTGEIFNCYFDGAIQPNPGGEIGAGVYIVNGRGDVASSYSVYRRAAAGNTNNAAEYLAFLTLMQHLADCDHCTINIYGDSQLVIRQMQGRWRILDGGYKDLALQSKELFNQLCARNQVKISWISRDKNTKADELSKQAIIKGDG